MTADLDAELDRLFRLPAAELVEARNALADQLRRAGDKAGAARIKAIKRAAPVAWAINQAWFEQRALLERAREATAELRELHARGVDTRQIAAAVERQRAAMQAVVDAALRAGRGAGLSETALQPRKVFTTVQAWLAGKGEEPPGRMTQELEASGFDAFAGMTLPAPLPEPPAPPAPPAADRQQDTAAEAVRAEAVRQAQHAREQRRAVALEQVGKRESERAAAERALEQAQVSVREAERQLVELRAMRDHRARELERCTAALEQARAALEQD
jgi:hypothetical protein